MITRDKHGNCAVRCDNCPRQSTAQPAESAARSWAQCYGWAERDGRDLCPWCKGEVTNANGSGEVRG